MFLFKEHFSYNLSHSSVDFTSFKGMNFCSLNVVKRLGNHRPGTSEMRQVHCEEVKGGEWSMNFKALSKQKIGL